MSATSHFGRLALAAAYAALAVLTPTIAATQSTLGTIRGTVTDPQKQVVYVKRAELTSWSVHGNRLKRLRISR